VQAAESWRWHLGTWWENPDEALQLLRQRCQAEGWLLEGWFPSLAGFVLVLEDGGEAPYRVDRMLTQWRTAGVLREVAAVGVGRCSWQEADILPGDFSLEEVLLERLGSLGVPLVGRRPVGHGRPNLALPLGAQARLDGDSGVLSLL